MASSWKRIVAMITFSTGVILPSSTSGMLTTVAPTSQYASIAHYYETTQESYHSMIFSRRRRKKRRSRSSASIILSRQAQRTSYNDNNLDDDDTSKKKTNDVTNSSFFPPLNLVHDSSWDSDTDIRRPRSNHNNNNMAQTDDMKNGAWDVVELKDHGDHFIHSQQHQQQSMEFVASEACRAIANSLFGKQRLDPNVVSNAMRNSVLDYRPVRQPADGGRLGIEIDGARLLLRSEALQNSNAILWEDRALRRLSLMMAAQLSHRPWAGIEEEDDSLRTNHDNMANEELIMSMYQDETAETTTTTTRPVVLFFKSVPQALLARQELKLLKLEEELVMNRYYGQQQQQQRRPSMYDRVELLCLGRDSLPTHMRSPEKKTTNGRREYGKLRRLEQGLVDPSKGIVLIASIKELPVVVISPRLSDPVTDGGSVMNTNFHGPSATYGGTEPPRGLNPWLLRDFTPPIYAWVGNALDLTQTPSAWRRTPLVVPQDDATYDDDNDDNDDDDESSSSSLHHSQHSPPRSRDGYTRVALTQSVMEEGHSWHMFAVQAEHRRAKVTRDPCYHYMASTKTSSGRPSRHVISSIFQNWWKQQQQ
eukprot:scaffold30866_cov44-Attheya_sp.AAC.1